MHPWDHHILKKNIVDMRRNTLRPISRLFGQGAHLITL